MRRAFARSPFIAVIGLLGLVSCQREAQEAASGERPVEVVSAAAITDTMALAALDALDLSDTVARIDPQLDPAVVRNLSGFCDGLSLNPSGESRHPGSGTQPAGRAVPVRDSHRDPRHRSRFIGVVELADRDAHLNLRQGTHCIFVMGGANRPRAAFALHAQSGELKRVRIYYCTVSRHSTDRTWWHEAMESNPNCVSDVRSKEGVLIEHMVPCFACDATGWCEIEKAFG